MLKEEKNLHVESCFLISGIAGILSSKVCGTGHPHGVASSDRKILVTFKSPVAAIQEKHDAEVELEGDI